MARTALTRTVSATAMIVALAVAAISPGGAADQRAAEPAARANEIVGSDLNARFLSLGVGKSVVLDLPRDIKDVLIADPKVANAVIRSSRRAYIIGAGVGQTNIFFFDADGRQISGYEIAVTRDLNGIRAAIKQALPASDIQVEGVGGGVVLYGNVATATESKLAYDIAVRLLLNYQTAQSAAEGSKVVNAITVQGRDQVMLKVTVAEVQRTVIKQLGIDLNGSFPLGSGVVNFNNTNPLSVNGPLSSSSIAAEFKSVTATLRAMEQAGVIHTLAEPTLTAISGESATFLAGGKFPVPVTSGSPPSTTVQWQNFGVSLSFTPVVLAEGRISLKVSTEVSELSTEGAISLNGQTVPALRTRDADTTVEIPSGGSLAMAGMIQEQTKQNINGLPGLMQVPVLGTLFKSRDFVNGQTELMVLVTPYIVRAVALKNLSRPDDGFADASDPATVLLGNLNRIYGVPANDSAASKRSYRGNYGFILD
jgi:pilus assembly protein CpaC